MHIYKSYFSIKRKNFFRTNSGSQMSAAEKLKIAKQTPTKSNPSVNGVDVPDSRTAGKRTKLNSQGGFTDPVYLRAETRVIFFQCKC